MMARKKSGWWQKHWDEVMLIIGVLLIIFLIMKGSGTI